MGRRDIVRRDVLRRWAALALLALAALPLYLRLRVVAGGIAQDGTLFLAPGIGVTLLAAAAAVLVFATRPAASRPGRWMELALLAAAGLAFRALFLGAAPALSHDAYRYVWDAQLVAHGVSPYTHTVVDPALARLRDAVIWPRVAWRDAPTLYPPGAQVLYLLVHLVAPLNIGAMQLAMALCDLLCGVLTMVLLRQRGLDPRRAVLYWWNPIPVLEFSFSAHVDAAATLWVLAALVVAGKRWRSARVMSGALLGLAVMTKLYPLLFAVALMRRRDWGFAVGLGAACLALAAPFVALGLGSGGFLGTYFAQRFVDQGLGFRLITTLIVSARAQLALQALALLAACGAVLWLRLRHALDPVAGMLALSAGWMLLSPHLFPWYVGGLLPLLALVLEPPERVRVRASTGRPYAADVPERAHAMRPYDAIARRRASTGRPYESQGRSSAGASSALSSVSSVPSEVNASASPLLRPLRPLRPLRLISALPLLRVLRVFFASFAIPAIPATPWLALWLFVLLMPFTYVIFAPGQQPNVFLLFFVVPLTLGAAPHAARIARHILTYAHAHSRRDIAAVNIHPIGSKE